jgi:DNA-binding NarL/FixJ family response regulator
MANEKRPPGSSQSAGPIALTADSDEFFRITLKSLLVGRLGFQEVIGSGSFDEAIEQLAERADVSLALFDLQMPGLENPMNLQVVREHFPKTRVVVVSGWQRREDIMAALQAGVHGYVPKSLSAAELANALKLILQGSIFVPTPNPPPETIVELRAPTSSTESRAQLLTPRQRQVLPLLVEGKSNREIARLLNLGDGTVNIQMAALIRNLGAPNRAAAAVVGARLLSGPTSPPALARN